MRVAIVHDWLDTFTGAEKVLAVLLEMYPTADVFTLVDVMSKKNRKALFKQKLPQTSFLQKFPFHSKIFRYFLPLFPWAIESFDVKKYDLVISSSWAVAKGVKTHNSQLHISYCHTPIRYAWDMYDEYTRNLTQPKKWLVQRTLQAIKAWDFRVSDRVDFFIANSAFVKERIRSNYGREAEVIHPPVDTGAFRCGRLKEDFYLTVSRLVPYKKTRIIVEAFNQSGRPLVVIGSGEELNAVKQIAESNVNVLGWRNRDVIIDHMQRARGFVYAAEEDFGIVPVEAMSCGTPVIAYGVGGVRDSVIEGKTGVFFDKQTPESLNEAVERFETMLFDAEAISKHAGLFGIKHFKTKFRAFVKQKLQEHFAKTGNGEGGK